MAIVIENTEVVITPEETPVVVIEVPIGLTGAQGLSTYELAVSEGFVGTLAEWLAATEADRIQTGLDVVSTGENAAATAEDLVQTYLDTLATAADREQTGLDAISTSASASAASSSASTATTKAGEASVSAAEALVSQNSAAASAASASAIVTNVATGHPTSRPALLLNFAQAQALDPRITFSRASTASRYTSSGLLEVVAVGVPRFDFDPVTGACKGLLIEEQRTNLLTYSEQFDNAAWLAVRTIRTGIPAFIDQAVAPDGTTNADKVIEDTATGAHHIFQASSSVLADNTIITASVFVKAAERSGVVISIYSKDDSTYLSATFDTATNTFSSTRSGYTASSVALPNGWYRISLTGSCGVGTVANRLHCFLHDGISSTYTGDGTSGLYIWGAQLEVGAFPTSYIPTTTAAATRSADLASMTGTNFSAWYRQDEGSFVAKYLAGPDDDGTRVLSVNDGTASNCLDVMSSNTGSTSHNYFAVLTGGVSQAYPGATTAYTAGATYSLAAAYKVNDFALSRDGGVVATETLGTVPGVSQMNIGNRGDNTANLNGHISYLAYYPKRISNTELQVVTQG